MGGNGVSDGTETGWRRFLPGLALLVTYRRSWLAPDLVAGLTVGAMLIPQSMSYADLAGLPPEYGFYAVIGALVVYALVGTSRHLGVGPEPGTAILAASGVTVLAGGDPDRYVALMAALALTVAAVCVVASLLRLGYLASMLSKAVLVGYITGVGLTLLSSQIAPFTGVPIEADEFFGRWWEFAHELDQIDATTTLLAGATLAVMLFLRRRYPTAPAALIGVVLATVATAWWSLDERGVALVGEIPAGLPSLAIPDVSLHDLRMLLPVAAGIALVGFTDNVLTGRAVAAGKGYTVEPNQELLALGLVNLSAGLSQGFPVSSSASRTAVPASLGSRTQLVSIVASAFVVATLLLFRPLLAEIPRAALAAVIVMAAIAIIDVAGFRSLWAVSRQEAVLAGITAFGVMVLGVLYGIVIAIVLSIAVALERIVRPHDAVLGDLPDVDGWVDVVAHPGARTASGLVVFRFDAPLFFVNSERFAERVEEVLDDSPGVEDWFVLDCEGIGALDATAVDMLRQLVVSLRERQVHVVAVARANERVLATLRRGGLVEPDGDLRVYPTINAAVEAFRSRGAS